jgi:hypothetical protein
MKMIASVWEGLVMKAKLLGVAVVLLGASAPVYAQGSWTFTTIDDPAAINSTNGTYAQGNNDTGQIVGYYYDSSGNAHGFSEAGGSFITLNYPGAHDQTFAEGVNNKGDVVGWYNDRPQC